MLSSSDIIVSVLETPGISSIMKIFFQIIISVIAVLYLLKFGNNDHLENLYFPFFKNLVIHLGLFFIPFAIFIIVGSSNAVNLTDGLDGLVAGSSAVSFGAILIIAFWIFRHPDYYSNFINPVFISVELAVLISSIAGSCLGFLWWNTNPAKIIMGDVGSQFIGSMFPLILFSIGADTLILFFCFLYIGEALSVIIQVLSFKYRGKRVFKMTPIHHHFEMSNWAETTIIVRFWIINGIVIVIGLGLFYGDWVLFGN